MYRLQTSAFPSTTCSSIIGDNPVIRTDGTGLHGKSQQWTGSSVERLSFGSVSFGVVLCRVASALVCPCDLGECSLVCWLFFQNLPGIVGYGLQCLGLEEFSSNILVSETCDFFYTISFCRFSNFKNLSSPELALFQGVFRNILFRIVVPEVLAKLLTIEKFQNFYLQ